jgi:Fe-S-cluster containining protein
MQFTYNKNICFSCSSCGLCCGDTEQKTRHILLLQSEAERLAEHTKKPIDTFAVEIQGSLPYVYEMRKDQKGKCIFLKDKQCIAYQLRPLICRFYPFELSTGQDGIYIFTETDECPEICYPKDKKLLDSAYFEGLLQLADAEFKCNLKLRK